MYCVKCGKELPESAQFCPNCGTSTGSTTAPSLSQSAGSLEQTIPSTAQQSVQPVPQQSTPPLPKEELQCPRCGADGCVPQYKQNVSGGGYGCLSGCLGWLLLGPLGLLCGACGNSVQSTNELVWICPKCGNEFKKLPPKEKMYKLNILYIWYIWFFMTPILFGSAQNPDAFLLLLFLGGIVILPFGILLYNNLKNRPFSMYTDEQQQKMKNHAVIAGASCAILFLISLLFF